MFVIDDIFREVVAYIRERALDLRRDRRRDVREIFRSLRAFEVALADIAICMSREFDELAAKADDTDAFHRELARFLRSGELHRLASSTHSCAALIDARDTAALGRIDRGGHLLSRLETSRGGLLMQVRFLLDLLREARLTRESPDSVLSTFRGIQRDVIRGIGSTRDDLMWTYYYLPAREERAMLVEKTPPPGGD